MKERDPYKDLHRGLNILTTIFCDYVVFIKYPSGGLFKWKTFLKELINFYHET